MCVLLITRSHHTCVWLALASLVLFSLVLASLVLTPSFARLDTPFKQQRLPAWQPILTPNWVILTFTLVGLVFLPVGIVLTSQSNAVTELIYQYDGDGADTTTDCKIEASNTGKDCTITYTLTEDMKAPVYVYYELENFYQNHRKYVKSLSSVQLRGEDVATSDLDGYCAPLTTVTTGTEEGGDEKKLDLNPCGLVANSLFNDVVKLASVTRDGAVEAITWDETGIAWESDVKSKFSQPVKFEKKKCTDCASCVECDVAGWCVGGRELVAAADPSGEYDAIFTANGAQKNADATTCTAYYYPDDDTTQYLYESYPKIVGATEGVNNEHFIVWMRTAGLPKFRKLYASIDKDLVKGDVVEVTIENNFDTSSFKGKKSIVLSTVSWFGGKNPFLGQSYIAVGSICLVLAAIFGVKHMISPRKLGDTKYLVWKDA